MDTEALQVLIRQSLTVPPVVRARRWEPPLPSPDGPEGVRRHPSVTPSGEASTESAPREVWRISFNDLIPPAPRPTKDEESRPSTVEARPAEGADAEGADAEANEPAERLRAALVDLGVQGFVVDALTDTALASAAVARTLPSQDRADHSTDGDVQPDADSHRSDHTDNREELLRADPALALLDAITTLTTTAGKLDSVLLSATSALTADTGEVLLGDKGFASPEELTQRQRELWRRRMKNLTRREICAATGWGEGEVTDLVALANTPDSVQAQVHASLRSGEATWRLARSYFRAASTLDAQDSAAIAASLFGDDPTNSVTERLNSAGEFHGHPWWHKEYYRALNREVAQAKARDPQATKKTREDNLAGNDVRLNLDEHGTGCLMIGTTAAQGAAMIDRITKAAKAARAAGDPRTLRELRVAVATSLLLHGAVDLPDLPDDPALITVEQSAQLNKILHALPTAELNVIVPLNTLLGTTPDRLTPTDAEGRPLPVAFASGLAAPQVSGNPNCTCACTCGAAQPPPGPTSQGEDCPDPPGDDCSAPRGDRPDPPGDGCSAPEGDGPTLGADRRDDPRTGEVGVAEVVGAHSLFLAPDEARTLALTPGSTLYRLLTDPATGSLVERSSRAYQFDGAMRAHIVAADMFCRAPGCLKPASMAQIDHAQEYGTPGGHTCVSNGHPLDAPHHDLKTKKFWDAVLHANRDVTWTTLLGRIYVTKTHDYRQYTRLLTTATDAVTDQIAGGMDPAEAVDRQIYQALTYRPAGSSLQAPDDDFHSDEQFTGWDQVTPTHSGPSGRRSYHPEPDIARAEHDRMHGAPSTADSAQGQTGDAETSQVPDTDRARQSSDTVTPPRSDTDTPPSSDADRETPWASRDETEPPF